MIDSVITAISYLALALGSLLMIFGALGLLRFPDFYSRMHAAGITDTLATFLILGGLMLTAGWSLGLAKLALILLFIFFTGPTASHALAKAAHLGAPVLKTSDSNEPLDLEAFSQKEKEPQDLGRA